MWFINKCYVKFKYNKCKFCCSVPHTKFLFCFLACSQLVFGWLYFAAYKMPHHFFSLNLLGTVLLYIMINSSFMSVHHLVCHLDLNEMKTHKVATLSLRWWLYQITWSASFEGCRKFWSNFPFDVPSVLETLSECSFFIHLIPCSVCVCLLRILLLCSVFCNTLLVPPEKLVTPLRLRAISFTPIFQADRGSASLLQTSRKQFGS